jgi:hypothetical protein
MNKLNLTLKTLRQTCNSCPSQWEGELTNGNFIYIRFRWGNLGYGIGATIDQAVVNYDYGEQIGDEFDGNLSQVKMLRLLGLKLVKE